MSVQGCPQCRWVPVVDESGRRRLEMRWGRPGSVTTLGARTSRTVAAHAA
ncbi:hypothetical protein [Modestobacter excelsi]|nr:hypothetical protein [Modestobacter excelsi]